MNNFLKNILIPFCAILLSGCSTEDYVAVVGGIEGIVIDSQTKEPIVGCEVTTMKYGTKRTDENGSFSITDVEPGVYSLIFKSDGYELTTKEVTVTPGIFVSANASLNHINIDNSIYPNHTTLDFGNRTDVLPLILTNPSNSTVSYYISSDADWISTDPTDRGSIVGNSQVTIKISVDRSKISDGHYEKVVTIKSSDKNIDIQIIVDKGTVSRPTVHTVSVSQGKEKPNSIVVEGSIIKLGNSSITQHGFCYSIEEQPTLSTNLGLTKLGNLNSPTTFSGMLLDLEYNKEYNVCAYATNSEGTSYGEVLKITLLPPGDIENHEIVTSEASDIQQSSAILNGVCKNGTITSASQLGFYYGTTPSCEKKIVENVSLNSDGMFKLAINNLNPETKYYFKAFIAQEKQEKFGEVKSFTTLKADINVGNITIVTEDATKISSNTAVLNGAIATTGDIKIKEYGFYTGTVPTPTKRSVVKSFNNPTSVDPLSYSLEIKDLNEGSEYYYQAYAIDEDNNIHKGSVLSLITTKAPTITIETLKVDVKAINITKNNITFSATAVLNPNGQEVIEAGFICKLRRAIYDDARKFVCEIISNKIMLDYTFDSNYDELWGYAKAYMILSDNTIIYSNEDDGIYFSPDMSYPQ